MASEPGLPRRQKRDYTQPELIYELQWHLENRVAVPPLLHTMIAAPRFEKNLRDSMQFWSMDDHQIETRVKYIMGLVNDCLALSGQNARRGCAISPH